MVAKTSERAPEHFGASLRAARLEQRMSLEDVAKKLGVTRQAVSLWENSENLEEATVRRYAAVLGLEVRVAQTG